MTRNHWAALASLLLIPVVVMGGMGLVVMINPEWALHAAHYGLVFRLLEGVRHLLMLATLAATAGLWLAVFFFILRSKRRSLGWIALAAFGPFGLAVACMLGDGESPLRLGALAARVAFELVFFYAAWTVSYRVVLLWRDAQVLAQAASMKIPVAQVVAQQAASSGMWAFSEGLELLFLLSLIYLARPIVAAVSAKVWNARR